MYIGSGWKTRFLQSLQCQSLQIWDARFLGIGKGNGDVQKYFKTLCRNDIFDFSTLVYRDLPRGLGL